MALDSPVQRDGDQGFIGYASRLNPVTLPAGMLQLSENMRLDRGSAVTRKGAKRLADSISVESSPVTVPFILRPNPNEPVVRSVYTGGIFSAASVRSPDQTSSIEVIVVAGPDRAYTFLPEGTNFSSSAWGDLLAASSTDNFETETGEEIVAGTLRSEIAYPSSVDETIEPTDKVSMLQAFDRLYIFREADTTQAGWETKYTNSSGISVSSTTATVNVNSHGYTAGMRVRIEGSASAAFDGHEYDIATASTNSFTITVPSGTATDASANIAVRRVKPPIYWSLSPSTNFVRTTAGIPDVGISYRRMRSTAWANYINNRLIVPDGKQNVLISDILDPDVFDIYWQSFRVGVGGNDFVVAVHPWVDNNVLVFCRKSIWIANIDQYPSPDGSDFTTETGISSLTLLTDEIGCRARRSIATAGQYIYFLSDNGVYRLDSRLDLKLRGDTKPLSDSISDQISDLSASLAGDSVGLYFDNRYYLAVPLANATDSNNGVFIYNQLNEQWESKDIYGFGVNDFIVSDLDNRRRILISNRAGKLMLLDELEGGDDPVDKSVTQLQSVSGKIKTRRYNFGSMHSKRFLRTVTDVVIPSGASVTTKIGTINPDAEDTIGALTNSTGASEDYNMKSPIRYKAHAAEVIYETANGRPEIRSASIEASPKSLPDTETRNAA